MSRTTTVIPFLYPVDVLVRGAVRRVPVLGRAGPVDVPFDGRRMMTNRLSSDRGSHVAIRFLEDGGRHHAAWNRGWGKPTLHPEIYGATYTLKDVVGGDLFASRARRSGFLRILAEEDAARLEILASHRGVVAARAELFASSLVETVRKSGAGAEVAEIDTSLRETVVCRDPGSKDETRGRGHVVETGWGWRVHDFGIALGGSAPFHPRILRPDGQDDPYFVYRRGYGTSECRGRVDGRFPEASANLHQTILLARQACLAAALAGTPSSGEEEILGRLDASAAAHADTLSPAPTIDEGRALVADFASVVLDGGTPFAASVRRGSDVVEDFRWFESYWKRRGAAMAPFEQVDAVVPPAPDEDDAAISFGMGV